uniref:GB1/RHD3-type G domain-containing protein n=1 Tax=Chelonoidis abingdonii TaxID=106734 RepID=A0A8C0GWA3_CHEAB
VTSPRRAWPVCLVANLASGELEVTEEALEALRGVDQHVVVVAVAGLYRTGKSYLLNQLAGRRTGETFCFTSPQGRPGNPPAPSGLRESLIEPRERGAGRDLAGSSRAAPGAEAGPGTENSRDRGLSNLRPMCAG